MRSAGTTDAEQLRTPASSQQELRRPAGDGTKEFLRVSNNQLLEVARAATSPEVERLYYSFFRLHPLVQGCTVIGTQGVAGLAVAGCAVTGLDLGARA